MSMQAVFYTAWTEERVATAKRLWVEGYSAAQIAAELGGITRNAVIGKMHRIGVAGGERPLRTPQQRKRRAAAARWGAHRRRINVGGPPAAAQHTAPRFEHTPAIDDAAIPIEQRRTLLQLDAHNCRWPVGHPDSSDFFFCGAPAADGYPYCTEHCRRAFVPLASSQQRRAIDYYCYFG